MRLDRNIASVSNSCSGGTLNGPPISAYLHKKWGKYLLDDGLYDIDGPIGRLLGRSYVKFVKDPRFPGGQACRGEDIARYTIMCAWASNTEQALMNITEQLEGNYEAAASLWERYKARLTEFRSQVKNDVTSLDAAARKSTEATNKMVAAYGHVITTLTSDEMQRAVENAERLAAAMQLLSKLESHRLVLSVTEQDKSA